MVQTILAHLRAGRTVHKVASMIVAAQIWGFPYPVWLIAALVLQYMCFRTRRNVQFGRRHVRIGRHVWFKRRVWSGTRVQFGIHVWFGRRCIQFEREKLKPVIRKWLQWTKYMDSSQTTNAMTNTRERKKTPCVQMKSFELVLR